MSTKMFNKIVKAVVDIEQNIMMVDADMHADQEDILLENGSQQGNLWGINLHPSEYGTAGWVEVDAMINFRPSWGNVTRGVDDPMIREKIIRIVNRLVTK